MATKSDEKNRLQWFLEYLSSSSLLKAILVLGIVLFSLNWLVLLVFPEPKEVSQWSWVYSFIGTRDLENSPLFLALVLVFLLNLALCVLLKELKFLKKKFNLARYGRLKLDKPKFETILQEKDGEAVAGRIKDALRGKYRLEQKGSKEERIIAHRCLFNKWSILLFHLSFIFIVLGVFLNYLVGFTGQMELAEGYFFQDSPSYYQRIEKGPFFPGYTGFRVANKKFVLEYYPSGNRKFYGTELEAIEGEEVKKLGLTAPNYPVFYRGRKIFQSQNYGLAVTLYLVDRLENYSPNLVYFSFQKGQKGTAPLYQEVEIVEGIKGRFGLNIDNQKKPELRKGSSYSLQVSLYKDGEKFSQKTILPKERIKVNDQYDLTFGEVNYYSGLQVSCRPGNNVLYFGFLVAIVSLILYYFFRPEVLLFILENERRGIKVKMQGFTSKFAVDFSQKVEKIWRNVIESDRSNS